jgi:hypothetical protein
MIMNISAHMTETFYKICGYVGTCGGIVVPEELQDKQLSLFEEE